MGWGPSGTGALWYWDPLVVGPHWDPIIVPETSKIQYSKVVSGIMVTETTGGYLRTNHGVYIRQKKGMFHVIWEESLALVGRIYFLPFLKYFFLHESTSQPLCIP